MRLPLSSVLISTSAGLKYWMRPLAGLRKKISFSTMPCVSRRAKGSFPFTKPLSRITFHQKREYSRCRMACSMPPMYWSTGIQ